VEDRRALLVVAATLGVVTVTLATASGLGRSLGAETALHAGVLGLALLVAGTGHRIRNRASRTLVSAATVIGSMFFLYSSLGRVAFIAIPWDGDAWARAADRALFGFGAEPVARVAEALAGARWAVEPLALFYGAFIPYLYLSIFLGLVGRPEQTRRIFVLAFALLYGASFMGYLFVPARGPVVAMTDVLPGPLAGGFFHSLVVRAIDLAGGPHGAFPSLHVGASSMAAIVDFRHGDRLRALIYAPLVVLIGVATVALRYHYVVDVLAGLTLAWAAVLLAERYAGAGVPESSVRTAETRIPA
jgi:membrane-associated phospholipid phosphatase